MKSIERRFLSFQEKFPNVGDIINLRRAVEDQGFNRTTINKYLNKLVNKGDYESGDKSKILDFLESASKVPEETQFGGKNAPGEKKRRKMSFDPNDPQNALRSPIKTFSIDQKRDGTYDVFVMGKLIMKNVVDLEKAETYMRMNHPLFQRIYLSEPIITKTWQNKK